MGRGAKGSQEGALQLHRQEEEQLPPLCILGGQTQPLSALTCRDTTHGSALQISSQLAARLRSVIKESCVNSRASQRKGGAHHSDPWSPGSVLPSGGWSAGRQRGWAGHSGSRLLPPEPKENKGTSHTPPEADIKEAGALPVLQRQSSALSLGQSFTEKKKKFFHGLCFSMQVTKCQNYVQKSKGFTWKWVVI